MQPTGPSVLEQLLPLVAVFAIFYFLILRPQSKKLKQHESFLKELKRGDAVITNSGMFGTIDGITEQFITLEIAQGVKVKMLRKQVAGSQAALQETKKN